MNIFCITNNKGGVAKTTSTVDLAYALADKGYKILVVDTDPQCNSTYSLLGNLDQSKTLFEILIDGIPMEQAIVPTKHTNLFVVPCSINLSAADLMLASAHGRERKLERAIRPVKDFYDFIIIDTPPHLGVLTINALIACTDVLIPFSLTTYSLIGVGILEKTMQELRDNLDVKLPILGVFACLDDHTNINRMSSMRSKPCLRIRYLRRLFPEMLPWKKHIIKRGLCSNINQTVKAQKHMKS